MFGIANPEQRKLVASFLSMPLPANLPTFQPTNQPTNTKKAEGGNLQLRWRNISPADVQGVTPSFDVLKLLPLRV